MKRSSSLSLLLSRDLHWLPRWQELLLNWVASWSTVGTLIVTSADEEHQAEWNLPTDLDMQRAELEELLR